ncbi:MAG: heme-binding domain-containing protein [Phaeodactylibacter sp.]|nr:heme-binding domain-containing protein [Phaeodactylibacter sp.]
MSKITKRFLLGLLAVLVIIQFFRIDKTNPPVDASQEFIALVAPPADVSKILKDACYDCHSHETAFPWYTNVAPVSWWIANHIEEGRRHLNFSVWGTYAPKKQAHKAEECAEEVKKGEMPLSTYTPMHPEARLTDEQRTRLAEWFMALSTSQDISGRVRESASDALPEVEGEAAEHEHEHE